MSLHTEVPGFKYIGDSKDYLWGKFLPTADGQAQVKTDIRSLRSQERGESLPVHTRDRVNAEITSQLSLHKLDIQDLEKRGISLEEARLAGFRSVESKQKLERIIPYKAPGLNVRGDGLSNFHPGYLCPVRDIDGKLVAFQVRLRGGGYRWLSSYHSRYRTNGARPNLPNGELPLAVWRPETVTGIGLVEGTGAKPFLAARRMQQLIIGAAGGNWAASPETLKESLQKASTEFSTKIIHFYPDAGAIGNANIMRAYRRTWELVRRWGYSVRVAWWVQLSKATDCDIDELLPDQYQALEWITTAKFEALANEPSRLWEDVKKLFTKAKTFTPKAFKGFANPSPIQKTYSTIGYVAGELPTPDEYQALGKPKIIFRHRQRDRIWEEAIAKGWKNILDSSAPGLGKSHTAGVAIPERMEVKQIFYFDTDHRNPSTEPIERNYTDLPVRNAGMVRDTSRQTPMGNDRIRWPKDGEEPDVNGNCFRAGLFAALRGKNIEGVEASGESPVCLKCHLRDACRGTSGAGFGFRHLRQTVLKKCLIRAHPDSAPQVNEFDYKEVGAFWEEGGKLLKPMKVISVGWADFEQAFAMLSSEFLNQLSDVRSALLPLFKGELKPPLYGFDNSALASLLPPPEKLEPIIDKLEAFLDPDLGFLDSTAEYGVSFEELPNSLKRKLRGDLTELSEAIQKVIPLNWIVPLLRVWCGRARGSFRFDDGRLSIYLLDSRHATNAFAMKWNIWLDATISREYLGMVLGNDQILEIAQELPKANLAVVQVTGLGKLGKNRSKIMTERVKALREALLERHSDIAFGDWKQHADDGDGTWFVNLRGSNEFQSREALATFGIPYQNLGHLQALWHCLTGDYLSLSDPQEDSPFQTFVNATVSAEIVQAIGRLRAHLRPDQTLTYYFVGDHDLSFLNELLPDAEFSSMKASDLSLGACSFMEANLLGIWRGLKAIAQLGEKDTQTNINQHSNISQGQISKVAKACGGMSRIKSIFQTLLSNSIAKGIIATQEETFLAREFLRLVLEEEPEKLIAEISSVIGIVGAASWQRIVAILPAAVRVEAISRLTELLGFSDFVKELEAPS